VIVDGRTAEVSESDFPAFEPDQHHLLFLTEESSGGVHSVLGGAQGAFVADGDRVSPMRLQPGVAGAGSPAVSREVFLGELRALLQFSER
jgi:hypothetical protein